MLQPLYPCRDMQELVPKSESDLADAIAAARAPLRIQGGGTRSVAMSDALEGPVLSTRAMTGIQMYDPGALTLSVRAGTTMSEVEKLLATEGQRLAFEPMDHRPLLGTSGAPTIGGVVAGNVSGPRRIQVGACRDHLLGVRFVDGQGRILKSGGRETKNVTGHDLIKVMAGSWGALGVLTELSLKVLPAAHSTGVLLVDGLSDADAIRAMALALGSPYDVTGAAHLQSGLDNAPVTLIRLEGFEESVAYRLGELRKLLAVFGDIRIETDPERTRAGWRYVRDVGAFHAQSGDVWRISSKPPDAPKLVAALPGTRAQYDWGGGLIWLLVPPGSAVDGDMIRQHLSRVGGHATPIRGRAAEVIRPIASPAATLQAELRQKLDPRQIFNPGLMRQAAA